MPDRSLSFVADEAMACMVRVKRNEAVKRPSKNKQPRASGEAGAAIGDHVRILRVERRISLKPSLANVSASVSSRLRNTKRDRTHQRRPAQPNRANIRHATSQLLNRDDQHQEYASLIETADASAVRLLKAFSRVGNPAIKRQFVTLAEAIADNQASR